MEISPGLEWQPAIVPAPSRTRSVRTSGGSPPGNDHRAALVRLNWKPARSPRPKTSGQRQDPWYAELPQSQRHTGAGALARSSAVENDVAIARDFLVAVFKIFGRDMQSAGNLRAFGDVLGGVAQLDNGNTIPGFHAIVQSLR